MRAVTPNLVFVSVAAPAFRRQSMTLTCPAEEAAMRGVSSMPTTISKLALRLTRRWVRGRSPFWAALWTGVILDMTLTLAPFLTSVSTTSGSPASTAASITLLVFCPLSKPFAPFSRRATATELHPLLMAEMRGVSPALFLELMLSPFAMHCSTSDAEMALKRVAPGLGGGENSAVCLMEFLWETEEISREAMREKKVGGGRGGRLSAVASRKGRMKGSCSTMGVKKRSSLV
mmetsp:Transcript_1430/g.2524  ORF Transcript_1430/g.2524 Transcript_1430/m.2524 type:complete len:232 (+) Transcript_1430:648-1343(+)